MSHSQWLESEAMDAARSRGSAARAALAFYQDVLQGRRVWPTERADPGSAWFLVGGTLIEVALHRDSAAPPVVLEVDDPEEVAARCWDAGCHVRVRQDAAGQVRMSVVDPLGRRLDLVRPEATATQPCLAGGQEASRA